MTVTRVSPLTRTPNSHHYHCLISSLRSVLFCSHFISSSPSKSASEIDPFVVLLRESRRRRRGFHLFEPKGRKEGRREGRRLQVAKCICRRNRARPSCSQPESPFPPLPFPSLLFPSLPPAATERLGSPSLLCLQFCSFSSRTWRRVIKGLRRRRHLS